jgi:flagellar basal-body rod modification protein FlgD
MTISNIQAQYGATSNSIFTKEKQLDQNDFLRLMTAQLQQQDPFNPVNNQEMVAQMAQFSSLAGISETNTVLSQISEQMAAQTQLLQDIKAGNAGLTPTTQEG